MKKFFKRYYVIFILIILFVMPGISAWYFFNHPYLLSYAATNKGKLLQQPLLMPNLKKSAKWHLVFWSSHGCDNICMQQLEKLAKIRLALGRKLYEVDLNFLLEEEISSLDNSLLVQIKELGFHVAKSTMDLQKLDPIFIANPEDYLVLAFTQDVNPADIFHDLKQLLSNPNAGINPGVKS